MKQSSSDKRGLTVVSCPVRRNSSAYRARKNL